MTRRIVNRGTRLRPPSRLRHDIRLAGGFDRWLNMMITMFGDLTSLAVTIAYNADYWTIPDDPFNPSAWTEVES